MATKKISKNSAAKAPRRTGKRQTHANKTVHKKSPKTESSTKKLIIAIFVAVLSIGAITFVVNKNDVAPIPTATPNKASISLESTPANVAVGEKFTMNVYADSANTSVNVVQATIKYPTEKIQLIAINTDSSAYPIKAYEKSTGDTIEITRGILNGLKNKNLVASIEFLAKSKGQAEFTYNKDKTMLISEDGNKDILNTNSLITATLGVTN